MKYWICGHCKEVWLEPGSKKCYKCGTEMAPYDHSLLADQPAYCCVDCQKFWLKPGVTNCPICGAPAQTCTYQETLLIQKNKAA
ncbi:MAG: hypothetical protein A2908_03095 [Candidatus Staskawiczbacteria bacterium RIFCSPLOWO2_01_FULL_38_12b]|uniref:Uncharacterized protein n=1 Tax=Candidatus Staskawiczbacteria bacterium RIFCSPLOWO2_01_FULL_38_12b TaxID=1802214 RepID=A0A1G2ICH4_9BACT|nr:MAG: hypothetical protein A2908_03095 [Candidatus Staskawiczbacteria bacterium RIFCSPLOWO2_01_FULL_38_12b]